MKTKTQIKYPIYIPSKGRPNSLTANLLLKHNIPFHIVVESQDFKAYKENYGDLVIDLKGNNFGCVTHARNFIKKHASGHEYHWQIDDDIAGFLYVKNRKTLDQDPDRILGAVEKFINQYSNIGIAGLGSSVFGRLIPEPYKINKFAYTTMLIRTDLKYQFSKGLEEDLDFNLQLLTNHWCSVVFNEYLFKWSTTGVRPGGYTELNANGRRLVRQQNTIKKWPKLLKRVIHKKGDLYRIETNQVWKQFTHKLQPKIAR